MRNKNVLIIAVLILICFKLDYAQTASSTRSAPRTLRNADVITMVMSGEKTGDIIARIVSSPCIFDTFPPVMRDLKMRGVPDSVLTAMINAPSGPPSSAPGRDEFRRKSIQITLPAGTVVSVETAFSVSSLKLEKGNSITFLVTRPVYINGTLAIARNAVATARVIDISKAQNWGRPGTLVWEMQDVAAVDGTRIPLQFAESIKGRTRVPTIVAGAAATAALVFPYTSPVALVWAFQKGEEATLFGSRQFTAVVRNDTQVAAMPRVDTLLLYYSAEMLKRQTMHVTVGNMSFSPSADFRPSTSFLPSGSFLPTRN